MAEEKTYPRVAVMFAEGLEEVEGLTVVDLLFRAHIPCDMVAIAPEHTLTSSHNVTLTCHRSIYDEDFSFNDYGMIVLPGGIPGTPNLGACEPLCDALKDFAARKALIGAICAAPSILAELGLLDGRSATSNPGFQHVLAEHGAQVIADKPVVIDGSFITSQGMGTAIDFALTIISVLAGDEAVQDVRTKIVDMR